MGDLETLNAARILVQMKNLGEGVKDYPPDGTVTPPTSVPYRWREYDTRPPAQNSSTSISRTKSECVNDVLPPTPDTQVSKIAVQYHNAISTKGFRSHKPTMITVRKQQDYTLAKQDSDYQSRPNKMERFCKNLACHFNRNSRDNTGHAKHQLLEAYTAQLPPLAILPPPPPELREATHSAGKSSMKVIPDPNDSDEGLQLSEVNLYQSLFVGSNKYRCIKARLLFGWACIIEQNLRGGSGHLRPCHPFLGDAAKFRCINLGSSQAQMLCKGYDANAASKICTQFQLWGWLPSNDIFNIEKDAVVISEEAQVQFPAHIRTGFIRQAQIWDQDAHVPSANRMVISPDDLQDKVCLWKMGSGCGCQSGKPHFPISRPILPLGRTLPRKKVTASRIHRRNQSSFCGNKEK